MSSCAWSGRETEEEKMDYLLVLGDALSDLGLAGADHLVHLAAVLEEEEGGHGAHGKLSGEIADLIHVDLEEHHVGVLLAHLLDGGRDALARAAPRGKEVHHDLQCATSQNDQSAVLPMARHLTRRGIK